MHAVSGPSSLADFESRFEPTWYSASIFIYETVVYRAQVADEGNDLQLRKVGLTELATSCVELPSKTCY